MKDRFKRDGRRIYKRINGELCQLVRWTDSCSGCMETCEGYNTNGCLRDKKHGCLIGSGCHECGYTGKRRVEMFIPVQFCQSIKQKATP